MIQTIGIRRRDGALPSFWQRGLRFHVSFVCALLLVALCTSCVRAQSPPSDRDRLVGAWRLVELDQPAKDGKLNRINCCGMFVFTRDGHLAVQVMQRETKPGATAGNEQYAQGGYEASYGTFVLDERAHTFIFHVEGALVRSLIGKDLPRHYELSGNRLIVTSSRPDEHWKVIWQRE